MDEILMSPDGPNLLKEFKLEQDNMASLAGCTANVVLITPQQIFVANAGDARAILYSKEGQLEYLSVDHKPDDELEKQRINKAGGYVSEGRVNDNLNLTRAIGDLEYKKDKKLKPEEQIISAMPDIQVRERSDSHNFILIGCDGIWETKKTEEICEIVTSELNDKKALDKIVEDLLDQLIAKETQDGLGCDNMSCILIKFKDK